MKTKLTHYKLRIKRSFIRLLSLRIQKEKIFGFKVNFFNYRVFASLYKQMFITREYYFQSKTEAPFIIDCGSNIGMSILFFKWSYPKSAILSFEPDVKTFAILEKNVRENGLNHVELYNKAVSDTDGSVQFYSNPDNPGSLTMSIYSRWNPGTKANTVDTVKLSKYISKTVDFLKMDIEGAEDKVIDELAKEGKLRFIREMVMEYHHHMEPATDRLGKMLATLEENGFGYQIHSIVRMPFKKKEYQNLMIYAYHKETV